MDNKRIGRYERLMEEYRKLQLAIEKETWDDRLKLLWRRVEKIEKQMDNIIGEAKEDEAEYLAGLKAGCGLSKNKWYISGFIHGTNKIYCQDILNSEKEGNSKNEKHKGK